MNGFPTPRDPQATVKVDYWLQQSNREAASKLMQAIGRVDDPRAMDEHAARIFGLLQGRGLAVSASNLLHLARLVNVAKRTQEPTAALQAPSWGRLATDHAQWRLQRPETSGLARAGQPTPSTAEPGSMRESPIPGWFDDPRYAGLVARPDDSRRSVSPDPPGQIPQPRSDAAAAQTLPSWSDKQINDGIDKLARDNGIQAPAVIEVMKSLLLDPSMTHEQRAQLLNRVTETVKGVSPRVRTQLGLSAGANLRIALAEKIGMPFTAVIARIRPGNDPGLTLRVMGTINPGHREAVAKALLATQPGTDADVNIYRALDTIFQGGDFYASEKTLVRALGLENTKASAAVQGLQRAFGADRINLLRAMGFRYEQMLAMNPVGNELTKRFDPKLNRFSASEQALRTSKNLPNTREEAAERLIRVGVGSADKTSPLSYRQMLAIGLTSDKPWSMPTDIDNAYASAVPGSSPNSGSADMSRAFRVAQGVLQRDIPRGHRNDLMGRSYRQEINLVLLQTFGLGATRLGSGALESIPTDFRVADWPSPRAESESPGRPSSSTDKGTEEATWQQLVPLLQRHQVKSR